MSRMVMLWAGLTVACAVASAHYSWTFFAGRNAPFRAVPARFDLNVLPDRTVHYFVSDQAPGPLEPGDSFPAILSQIRSAAAVWDEVATADLKLEFGGLVSAGTIQGAPGIDVVFDDEMPPGVLAQTSVSRPADLSSVAGGASSVPILRARVQIRRDLTVKQQASYSETFFTTLVHEFGHALGLQHTMTSAAMSTNVTRATNRARPLAADDVAGISWLYPAPEFAVTTGTITGRVALAGVGVNLASVVAVSTSGVAISGMTNPDGTYRIEGIPPGTYYVYAHPLPRPLVQQGETTPANIVPPVDPQNIPFPANLGFGTQFFPGTRDWTQAFPLAVTEGSTVFNVDFNVQATGGSALANMQTYGFQGPGGLVPVPTPSLVGGRRSYLVFYADGAFANGNQLAPGLNVRVLGSAATVEPDSVRYYEGFVLMIINAATVTAATPVALAATVNNDLYVLPSAFSVVPSPAPAITNVTGASDASGAATVTLFGTNLSADTRVMFDGAPAQVLEARADGSLVVAAPPASGSHRAAVVALSADGQSSAQALGGAPVPWFVYSAPENTSFSINPAFVFPGTDALIEINGINTQFAEGQVTVGFGSSDIVVKRLWVVDRSRILVNVSVGAAAVSGWAPITVLSGLQVLTLKTTLQIQPLNVRTMSLKAPIVSLETGRAGVSAGRLASIATQGLPPGLAGWTLTIGGIPVSFQLNAGNNQILAQVPPTLPVGPTVVRLISPFGDYIPALAMQVDGPPPAILSATLGGLPLDAIRAARPGDAITLLVTSLAEPNGRVPAASAVRVSVAGVSHGVTSIVELAGAHVVQFVLSPLVPSGLQQVSVGVGTRYSLPVTIAVQR